MEVPCSGNSTRGRSHKTFFVINLLILCSKLDLFIAKQQKCVCLWNTLAYKKFELIYAKIILWDWPNVVHCGIVYTVQPIMFLSKYCCNIVKIWKCLTLLRFHKWCILPRTNDERPRRMKMEWNHRKCHCWSFHFLFRFFLAIIHASRAIQTKLMIAKMTEGYWNWAEQCTSPSKVAKNQLLSSMNIVSTF
jgi:hypothetical protein